MLWHFSNDKTETLTKVKTDDQRTTMFPTVVSTSLEPQLNVACKEIPLIMVCTHCGANYVLDSPDSAAKIEDKQDFLSLPST